MSRDDGIYLGYWVVENQEVWAVANVAAIGNLEYYEDGYGPDSPEYQEYVDSIWGNGPFYAHEVDAMEAAQKLDYEAGRTEYGIHEVGPFGSKPPQAVQEFILNKADSSCSHDSQCSEDLPERTVPKIKHRDCLDIILSRSCPLRSPKPGDDFVFRIQLDGCDMSITAQVVSNKPEEILGESNICRFQIRQLIIKEK